MTQLVAISAARCHLPRIARSLGVYLLIRVRTGALTPSHSAPQVVNIESHGTSSVYPRWMTPAEADVLLVRDFTGGAQVTTADAGSPPRLALSFTCEQGTILGGCSDGSSCADGVLPVWRVK